MSTCRVCGCDDEHACISFFGPCHWVEADLCSECQPNQPKTTTALADGEQE
jgi:hypothetical protein